MTGINPRFQFERDPVEGRVSIVIPAFNSANTVRATVESCLAQRYEDVEVIVVDDGSTDGTEAELRQFGARIRFLRKPNGGVASARNAGTRVASGEFIAWMDNDDLAHPQRLRWQVEVLRAHPEVVLVSSDFSAFVSPDVEAALSHISTYYSAVNRLNGLARIYPTSGVLHLGDSGPAAGAFDVRRGCVYESLLAGNFVHPPTVMVRRIAFEGAGPFDESLRYNSEYDMVVRMARLGPFAYIDGPLLRYRISAKQLSSESGSRGHIPLETVKVLAKVRRQDPAVHRRMRGLFRARVGRAYTTAAEAFGPSRRLYAAGLLARGMWHKLYLGPSARALARIVLPGFAVAALKSAVRNIRSPRGAVPGA